MGEYVCWRSHLNIVSQDEKGTKRRQSWPQSNTFEDRPIMSPTPSGCQAIPFHFAAHDFAKTTAFETPNSSSTISWKYVANIYDVFLTENLHKLITFNKEYEIQQSRLNHSGLFYGIKLKYENKIYRPLFTIKYDNYINVWNI